MTDRCHSNDRRDFLRLLAVSPLLTANPLLTIGAQTTGAAHAQEPEGARMAATNLDPAGLAADHYREDLEFLFTTVMDIHPRPDWRTSMDEIREAMEWARARALSCDSREKLFKIARDFLVTLRDSHTAVNWEEDRGARVEAPIYLTFVEGYAVVTKVFRDTVPEATRDVERGDVVLAVNGQEIEARLRDLLRILNYNNARNGLCRAAEYALDYAEGEREDVRLSLAKPDGRVISVTLPLVPYRQGDWSRRYRNPFEVRFDEELRAGVFAYHACVDKGSAPNAEFLAKMGVTLDDIPDIEETAWEFFTELHRRGWRRLILDIRANKGGDSRVAQHLFKHLTRRELITYGDNIFQYPYQSRLDEERLGAVRQFDGEMIVLIDEDVYSSGEWLAAELRANGMGLLVGAPTGGGGSVPGNAPTYTAPNTGLQFSVSSRFYEMPTGVDDNYPGVLPDYYVPRTLNDFREDRDTVMEFVRERWA